MAIEMKNKALEIQNNIKDTPNIAVTPILLLSIMYALLYIGDVLKDGFKRLEKKK